MKDAAHTQLAGALRRFKPYAAYKDSGVEWLGAIPAQWDVKRLKFVLAAPLKYGANEAAELDDPNLPRYVRITDIDENDRLRDETFKSLPADVAGEYLLREGDLLFARSGATAGKTFLYRSSWGACAYAGYLIRARLDTSKVCPEFVRYFAASTSYWHWVSSAFIQATIQNVSAERYASLIVPQPIFQEQRAIAAFLDGETTKINVLVAKKERLIELLQEKRTAVITRAVTKGLDPNVPIKDSGIEWLGELPAHWNTLALSRVTLSRCDGPFGSGLKSEHYSLEGVRVIRLQNIGSIDFLDADQAFIDETYAKELGDHSVYARDLLIAGLGDEGHPVGRACVAPQAIEPAIVKADCFRFRLDRQRMAPRFAAYQLSATAAAAAGSMATGATRARMNLTDTAGRKLALPPRHEQYDIVAFLDRETSSIDALVAKVREAIDRLNELRTALISAAVTGKIDVRGEVA